MYQPNIPTDNVQTFERVVEEGLIMQGFVDQGYDIDVVNELSRDLNLHTLLGEPVRILGGEIELLHINDELEESQMFASNTTGVEGVYRGLSWRVNSIEVLPNETMQVYRLCHKVDTSVDSVEDLGGNLITTVDRANVTVEGSTPILLSETGCHDYRRLSDDAFTLQLDKLALDDSIELQEKARIVSSMFRVEDISRLHSEEYGLRKQRLSYLNVLGIFKGAVVKSRHWIRRSDGVVEILSANDDKPQIRVEYVSTDMEVAEDAKSFTEGVDVLSFEQSDPDGVMYSIPFSSVHTRVFRA